MFLDFSFVFPCLIGITKTGKVLVVSINLVEVVIIHKYYLIKTTLNKFNELTGTKQNSFIWFHFVIHSGTTLAVSS